MSAHTSEDLIYRGTEAYRAGDPMLAARLFYQATQTDPQNQTAWLWLARLVDNPEDKRQCLERAVAINPQSADGQQATQQLAALPLPLPPLPVAASRPHTPSEAPEPVATPQQQHAAPATKKSSIPAYVWVLVGLGGLVFIPFMCIVLVGILTLLGGRVEEVDSQDIRRGLSAPTEQTTEDYSQPDGFMVDLSESNQPTNTPLRDDEIPPSLPIERLVPFTHEPTGISGVRPDTWSLFSSETSFQVSSSPEAPDGFVGMLIPAEQFPNGDIALASADMMDSLKENYVDGPPPEILAESYDGSGNATLLVSKTSVAQGSMLPIRFTMYARATPTPQGLLVSLATVPVEKFPAEEMLIRTMVDSLTIE